MKVGTRGSKLAQVQTNYIVNELSRITDETIEIKIVKTTGDKITDSQLYNLDAKGLFTKELDKYVLNQDVDFAVHSLKDVPTELDPDLEIVAIPPRESPHDVLISNYEWEELSTGSSLGSSSLRREAFCNHHGKKFKLKPLRGNVETRIKKVYDGECDATIMAEAGLNRLGLSKHIKKRFSLKYITPAAGQGALAVITRKDSDKKELLNKLNHYITSQEVLAEKTVLKELGVGCQWPLGVIAKIKQNKLNLYSILLTPEGEILSKVKLDSSIKDAEKIGIDAANIMKEDYN
ncbi:MAG: hydroxymethylbilane synthase [Methanobacteriaceae archaeon]|nr:hydroxymethylbilane synthase [Methanobacteriaceae archaeon]